MSGQGGGGKDLRPIIVKKVKRTAAAHHGGAWKVAYADFVTAMMAFFMVMWLIAAVTKEQRAAIFEYFKNPSMEQGKSVKASQGQMGPGGASTSVINMGGGLDARRSASVMSTGIGTPHNADVAADTAALENQGKAPSSEEAARKLTEAADRKKLESLMQELRKAIDMSQALRPFKDQLLLDITPEGLRIQIVDAQNRPMFDLGSAKLKDYTASILHELAPYLNTVPNHISLSGHTDTTPYVAQHGATNWDLSADRANAARRALEGGGLATEKIARIVGLSSAVLFDKSNPRNPINRRISIIVMTKQAEESALATDSAPQVKAAQLPGALAPGDAAQGETAPAAAMPAAAMPGTAVPGTAVPGAAVPNFKVPSAGPMSLPDAVAIANAAAQAPAVAH